MSEYTVRRAAGYGTWMEGDGQRMEADYLQCVHCQFTWVVQPGSGINRGFCSECPGPTCGKRECQSHLNWRKALDMLEQIERGLRKKQFFEALGI